MKVLLLSCQENADILGVKYLHAHLAGTGHDSTILLVPGRGRRTMHSALDFTGSLGPDVIGFSAMTYELDAVRQLATACRERFPRVPIIMGGVHATSDPRSCLSFADIVVRGEGEESLADVLDRLAGGVGPDSVPDAVASVPGIAYLRDADLVCTTVRQPLLRLDALPAPRHRPERMHVVHNGTVRTIRDPSTFRRYSRYQGTFLSVLSSRGCPFSCNYCSNSVYRTLYGAMPMRSRSARNVIEEIEREIAEFPDILYVNFADDCFLMHPPEWLEEFSASYRERVKIPFIVRTTPKHVTREKLTLLRQAGLRWVFMGLQTGSDRVNREVYGRNVTAREFLGASGIVTDLGLSPWYDVILDNPYETEEDGMRTMDVLLRTPRPFQLDLFSLDFFPGTVLRSRALRDGLPLPAPGTKSYTRPEPTMLNRYVRMTATLPPRVVRGLLAVRATRAGRLLSMLFYAATLAGEPFVYLRLVFRSNDHRFLRSLRVVAAFAGTAVRKLYLRRLG
jgi:radical SAM superfamily enzyme YgiQ (UPF0313 family)